MPPDDDDERWKLCWKAICCGRNKRLFQHREIGSRIRSNMQSLMLQTTNWLSHSLPSSPSIKFRLRVTSVSATYWDTAVVVVVIVCEIFTNCKLLPSMQRESWGLCSTIFFAELDCFDKYKFQKIKMQNFYCCWLIHNSPSTSYLYLSYRARGRAYLYCTFSCLLCTQPKNTSLYALTFCECVNHSIIIWSMFNSHTSTMNSF